MSVARDEPSAQLKDDRNLLFIFTSLCRLENLPTGKGDSLRLSRGTLGIKWTPVPRRALLWDEQFHH